jgi:hypothetical protein
VNLAARGVSAAKIELKRPHRRFGNQVDGAANRVLWHNYQV